jgi:predicted transcriptional regulator
MKLIILVKLYRDPLLGVILEHEMPDILEEMISSGLISKCDEPNRYVLTDKGYKLANQLMNIVSLY